MTKRLMILAGCLCLALLTNLSFRVPSTVQAQSPPGGCLQAAAPTFTLGTQKNLQLPGGGVLQDGDLFYLGGNSVQFRTSSAGASLFNTDASDFQVFPGYPNTNLMGFATSTANSTVTALSCNDSIWDINFVLYGGGSSPASVAGDVYELFLQQPDGSGRINLATFTNNAAGTATTVTGLIAGGDLSAIGHTPTTIGRVIPFEIAGGSSGGLTQMRTNLITLALPMNGTIPNCAQVGITIRKGAGSGRAYIVLVNLVVTRSNATTATGTGLQSGLPNLTYPTALVCPVACPVCPAITCDLTICFAAACDWCNRLTWSLHNRRDFWVRVPGLNFGLMVSPYGPFSQAVQQALGCSGYTKNDPYSKMVAEYVAAQLSVQATTPFWYPQLSRQKLACHVTRMLMGNQQRAIPVSLSNGRNLDGNSSLQDLFDATDAIAVKGTIEDYNKLLNIYMQLNNCRKD